MISWAMRKLGVEEWLVSAVMSVYTGAKTVVRTVYGNSNGFEVKVVRLLNFWDEFTLEVPIGITV